MNLGQLAITRVNAPKLPTATVIFLHGLGDSGDGWSFLPSEVYKKSSLQHINFILPSAPVRPITAFHERVPGWFDVLSFDGAKGTDTEGVLAALASVRELIDQEIAKGIPAGRIVLGGFSQGAALTYGSALTLPHKLAGFVPVSGYVPETKALSARAHPSNLDTPLLALHGTADQVVPYAMGRKSFEILKGKFGYAGAEWRQYDGLAHSISLEGLDDLIDFLERVLPN